MLNEHFGFKFGVRNFTIADLLHGSTIKRRGGRFSHDSRDFGTVGVPREHQTPDGLACLRQSDVCHGICIQAFREDSCTRILSY